MIGHYRDLTIVPNVVTRSGDHAFPDAFYAAMSLGDGVGDSQFKLKMQ
jgi:hypothetical protein